MISLTLNRSSFLRSDSDEESLNVLHDAIWTLMFKYKLSQSGSKVNEPYSEYAKLTANQAMRGDL